MNKDEKDPPLAQGQAVAQIETVRQLQLLSKMSKHYNFRRHRVRMTKHKFLHPCFILIECTSAKKHSSNCEIPKSSITIHHYTKNHS